MQNGADDGFRGEFVGFLGSHPAVKIVPNEDRTADSEILKKSLGDETQLDMDFVGKNFSFDLCSIARCLVMQMLSSGASSDLVHGLHPKSIGKCAQRVNRGLKGNFDFESESVEFDDSHGIEGQIS